MAASLDSPFAWLARVSEAERFAWLLGVLEVQGRFMRGRPSQPRTPRIELEGHTVEVLEQLAEMLGAKVGKKQRRAGTTASLTIGGRRAAAIMRKLQPFLGPRRQRQIERAVAHFTALGIASLEELDGMLCFVPTCFHLATGDDVRCAHHMRVMAVHHE